MDRHFKNTAENFLKNEGRLAPFIPFPKASDRKAYEALPYALKHTLIRMGEEALSTEYPTLKATDYMAFTRTGNRVAFEDKYFGRRHLLNSLVVAECVEHQGRFMDAIIDGIFLLCEESGWQLPPHNSKPGKSNDILPDSAEPVIDLFACETGSQLACILYLLKDALDAVSPYIAQRICQELTQRIITPYLTRHFWWMGSEDREMCNWTPWCTQNVLYTVFLSEASLPEINEQNSSAPEHSTTYKTFLKAADSLDYFLKDYGDDGCCDEGAQYYRHAGLCLAGAADVLNAVSGGAFAELMYMDKIKNIAAYIYNVHVSGKYYFNFADCSPIAGRAGVREYLFGKSTAQPGLMQFGAEDFKAADGDIFSDESNKLNLFYRMQTIFTYEEVMAYAEQSLCDTKTTPSHPDLFYPSVGLFLTRNDTFTLAVKAGDNDDSHNHNDTGSITLYKNGMPILVDIGVESYTAKTFSPRRYEIWTMQSGYHNLPTIDGLDQHDGAAYRASNVTTHMGEDNASISMELASAYPFAAEGRPLPSYFRKVTFDKCANEIVLRDTTNSQDVILNFITYEEPQFSENRIQIGTANLEYDGAELLMTETLPIADLRLKTAWDRDLHRIRLKMTGETFNLYIR